jgi:hypothetical protein
MRTNSPEEVEADSMVAVAVEDQGEVGVPTPRKVEVGGPQVEVERRHPAYPENTHNNNYRQLMQAIPKMVDLKQITGQIIDQKYVNCTPMVQLGRGLPMREPARNHRQTLVDASILASHLPCEYLNIIEPQHLPDMFNAFRKKGKK